MSKEIIELVEQHLLEQRNPIKPYDIAKYRAEHPVGSALMVLVDKVEGTKTRRYWVPATIIGSYRRICLTDKGSFQWSELIINSRGREV